MMATSYVYSYRIMAPIYTMQILGNPLHNKVTIFHCSSKNHFTYITQCIEKLVKPRWCNSC